MTDTARAVVLDFFATALSPGHDTDAVDRLLAAEFVDHAASAGDDGPASVRAKLSGLWTALPTGYYEVLDVVSDGTLVAVRSVLRGGSQPVEFADFYRVSDGRIAEHWHVVDAAALRAALTPPST